MVGTTPNYRWVQALNHKNNFDLIRLFAASQVVFMHAVEWLKLPFNQTLGNHLILFPGVTIFFVISGFLVTASFVNSKSAGEYFIKRALRIYPALWGNVALMALVTSVAYPSFSDGLPWLLVIATTASTIIAGLTFPVIISWPAGLPFFSAGVLWTIAVELSFYLIVPILFARPIRENRVALWLVMSVAGAGSLFAQLYQQQDHELGLLFTTIPAYLWIFLLGSAAHFAWSRIRLAFEGLGLIWLTAYLAYSFYANQDRAPDFQNITPVNVVQIVLLAGTVLSCAHTLPSLLKVLRGHDISYGVYLYHMPVIMLFIKLGWTGGSWQVFAVFVLTAPLAALSWFGIERPALRLKYRSGRLIDAAHDCNPSISARISSGWRKDESLRSAYRGDNGG